MLNIGFLGHFDLKVKVSCKDLSNGVSQMWISLSIVWVQCVQSVLALSLLTIGIVNWVCRMHLDVVSAINSFLLFLGR